MASSSDSKVGEGEVYPINYKDQPVTHFGSEEARFHAWEKSLKDPDAYWSEFANSNVDWFSPFKTVQSGSFMKGDIAWFLDGKLNVSYNCVDRWAKYHPDENAIIWEGNEPDQIRKITYAELLCEVSRIANMMKRHGLRKGDTAVVYMPMIPEAAFTMLACARLGVIHNVIFAGFSSDAIRDRIHDCDARYVFCADYSFRGPKKINLIAQVNKALKECPNVLKNFVFPRLKLDAASAAADDGTGYGDFESDTVAQYFTVGREFNFKSEMEKERPYCPCEVMDSEDTLFLLYTSGSTGKPKGVLHTTAGYLIWTMATHRYVFDVQPTDIYACVADVGWITGHSYIVYGPLANGATTFMFESTPVYPDAGRYWDMVQRHKINQLYTAPTAIRLLMKFDDEYVTKYDRSSLKVLGTVGEPINPESWNWYYKLVGDSKCPIVDTYWQTETGGHMITPLPGSTKLKPGSATLPFFGVEPALLDKETGEELPYQQGTYGDRLTGSKSEIVDSEQSGILVIKRPWPGIARTVYGDHKRYLRTYMEPYKGYYFTGDGAMRDKDGDYWITGRVDDVLNVAGHRLGTAEIESCVVQAEGIAEAAVVAVPDDLKGQAVFVYAITKAGVVKTPELEKTVRMAVREKLGAFATPKHVMLVDNVPKTRSGKIMRRILRKIASQEYSSLGDITTLGNSDCVDDLINMRKGMVASASK